MSPSAHFNPSASPLALLAAVGGIVCALFVGLVSGALWLDERKSDATTLGALAFMAVFVAPFVVLLASFWLRDIGQRRALWLGCAVVALALAWLTVFSVGMLFLFVAGALGWAWWAARRREVSERTWLSPLLTLWIVLAFGGALWLLWSRTTPMCWNGSGWTATASANHGDCTSDIIDTTEGGLTRGAVALGLVGSAVIVRFWSAALPVRRASGA